MMIYGKNTLDNQQLHIGNGEEAVRKFVKWIELGY